MTQFDWDSIQARYEMGETAGKIAKSEGTPSRQAIHNKARKEGWQVYEPVDNSLARIDALLESGQWGKCTPENKGRIIVALRNGVTYRVAAASIGVTDRTLRNWREKDSNFSALCDAALAEDITETLEEIKRMSKTDPNIARFRVQHHALTRGEYGIQAQPLVMGNHFNVLGRIDLGIQRDDPKISESRDASVTVIDGSSEEVVTEEAQTAFADPERQVHHEERSDARFSSLRPEDRQYIGLDRAFRKERRMG